MKAPALFVQVLKQRGVRECDNLCFTVFCHSVLRSERAPNIKQSDFRFLLIRSKAFIVQKHIVRMNMRTPSSSEYVY